MARNDPPLLVLSQSTVARAMTLETPGTSGPKKPLYFAVDDLEATIDFFHRGMAMLAGPRDRVANAFPAVFADAIVFPRGGKRRLLIQENGPCAPCC